MRYTTMAMEFIDTHCHIQEIISDGDPDDFVQSKWVKAGITNPQIVTDEAVQAGLTHIVLVGCTLQDSKRAIALAQKQPICSVAVGIHPHEASSHGDSSLQNDFAALAQLPQVQAIGECGLDYYYEHSPRKDQFKILEFQLEIAQQRDLPVIFHVREAFEDFWPIVDNFKGIRGVLHSYTDSLTNLEEATRRGLYIGLNGIMTFTKDENQLAMARAVPLSHLVLETDAPFLTPKPYRGTICTPKHVVDTAKFLSQQRQESLTELAAATTHNAKELFRLS